jgi:hypothetical protein
VNHLYRTATKRALPTRDAGEQLITVSGKRATTPGNMLIRTDERQVALVQRPALRHIDFQGPQRDSPGSRRVFHDFGVVITVEMKETEPGSAMIVQRAMIAKKEMGRAASRTGGWLIDKRTVGRWRRAIRNDNR